MSRDEELRAIEEAVTDGRHYRRVTLAEAQAHDEYREAHRPNLREMIRAQYRGRPIKLT